ERDQGLLDGGRGREGVETVADGDDRVRLRQGILRENEPANVIGSSRIRARQLEHRPRGVGGEDAVPGVDELPRQQAAPASELEDETLAFPHGLEELEDPRRAGIGVEAEAPVVHEREIGAVVGVAGKDHSTMVAPSPRRCRVGPAQTSAEQVGCPASEDKGRAAPAPTVALPALSATDPWRVASMEAGEPEFRTACLLTPTPPG